MRDRFSADPTIVFMTSVLEEVARGRLQIPRFQRPLVWDWSQRRDLLSSIFEGLPIGALMIWISSSEHVERYEKLGPYELPEPAPGSNRFLMDGVQRVSTLFGALHAHRSWTDVDQVSDEAVSDFSVLVDLDGADESERFVRELDVSPDLIRADPSRFMPLRYILDNRGLLRFQRSVAEGREDRVDVSDEVTSAFRQYKIPLITLNNASLETVTKSFQRVNSRGAIMSEMHMINALTYSPHFDLLTIDAELRRKELASIGWVHIDQDVVLRSLKLRLDVELYKPNPEEASRKLRLDPSAISDVFKGLRLAAELLGATVKVRSPELVPYRLQLICIAAVLGLKADELPSRPLVDWFWMTTYTEAFGLSARQSEVAISDLRRFLKTGKFEWSLKQRPMVRSPLGRKADFRAARGKALALALARRLDARGGSEGNDLLNTFKRDSFSSIGSDVLTRGRIGSRFLIDPSLSGQFGRDLLARQLSLEDRWKHLISDKAIEALQESGLEEFVSRREVDILEFEQIEIFGPAFERLGLEVEVEVADGSRKDSTSAQLD